MTEAIWKRVGPVTGLLFVIVLHVGFFMHGTPDVRPTDIQLSSWLSKVDVNRFTLGVYIEAIGTILFVPFAAWLCIHLRRGAGTWWPAATMFASATGWVILTLPINGAFAALVDQSRRGLDIRAAQTVVAMTQSWYDTTAIVLGLALVAAGVAILRGAAMSRWAGWAAIVIGVVEVVSAPFGTDSTPAGLLGYLWLLVIAGYYTFRPARPADTVANAAKPSVDAGLAYREQSIHGFAPEADGGTT